MTTSQLSLQLDLPPMELALMSSAADFRASHTVSLGSGVAAPTSAISGLSSRASFAKLDRDGSWRKMSQGYCQLNLDGTLEQYCETWPNSGWLSNGEAFQLAPLVLPTDATESGLLPWPTPTWGDAKASGSRNTASSKAHPGISLTDAVRQDGGTGRMWPTPANRDYRHPNAKPYSERGGGKKGEQLPNAVGGQLNPTWVEWLMGYPLGWTVLDPSAIRSSRKFRKSSGAQ